MKSSLKVTHAIKITFSLRKNPPPSEFIIKVNLRSFGLAPVTGPLMVFAASLTMTMHPPTNEVHMRLP